jgi:hypothetical protein
LASVVVEVLSGRAVETVEIVGTIAHGTRFVAGLAGVSGDVSVQAGVDGAGLDTLVSSVGRVHVAIGRASSTLICGWTCALGTEGITRVELEVEVRDTP